MARSFVAASSQRVDLPNESAFDREFNQAWSVLVAYKPASNASGALFSKEDVSILRGFNVFHRAGGTNPTVAAELSSDTTGPDIRAAVRTTGEFATGAWHIALVVYNGNGAASGYTIYVDSASAQALTTIVDALASSTTLHNVIAQVAARGGTGSPGFYANASVGMVGFWTAALTGTDAADLIVSRKAPTLVQNASLVSAWPLDEAGGAGTAADLKGANDGTYQGSPSQVAGPIFFTTYPSISGTASVGTTLTANAGVGRESPGTPTYQWQRDNSGGGTWSNIGGATSQNYTLQSADLGCNVRCALTFTNGAETLTVNTPSVGLVSTSVGPITSDIELQADAVFEWTEPVAPPVTTVVAPFTDPLTVIALQAGRANAIELTPIADSIGWSTAAVGGFGSAEFKLSGPPQLWRRTLPYLTLIRILWGEALVWEGQIEDIGLSVSGGEASTTVQCFGLQRLLAETSVRRVWSKRDLNWEDTAVGVGGSLGVGLSRSKSLTIQSGQFSPVDLTKRGIRVAGDGSALAVNAAAVLEVLFSGVPLTRLKATATLTGGNTGAGKLAGVAEYSSDGSTFSSSTVTSSGSFDVALPAGTYVIRLGAYADAGVTPTAADTVDWTDIRVLGTSVSEDVAGGYYGGTILQDLLALVPGLTPGLIEQGSDFVIDSLERAVRATCLDVVEEVASYYLREWGVWEGGRFDWTSKHFESPDWVVTIAECDQLSLDGSVDGIARTNYVLYSEAASGIESEQSSSVSEQRNPYFKQGRVKDVLTQPGFPMTANTAAQLAATLGQFNGRWIPTTGTITLPARRPIRNARTGAVWPAFAIRAGQQILIPDLPKDDIFQTGRDGQTLFHIASTNVDAVRQTVTLELEGQGKTADALLARLAAVTRTLTG